MATIQEVWGTLQWEKSVQGKKKLFSISEPEFQQLQEAFRRYISPLSEQERERLDRMTARVHQLETQNTELRRSLDRAKKAFGSKVLAEAEAPMPAEPTSKRPAAKKAAKKRRT